MISLAQIWLGITELQRYSTVTLQRDSMMTP